jgi:mannosyltransferase
MEATARSTALVAVIALTVLAVVLRSIGLNQELWYDEILTLIESVRSGLKDILTIYPDTNHHPLFAVLSHASVSLLGEHPWTVRLPAMLFGAASVPMLYVLGRVAADRREALLASLLLATSYHHIWFSQNARGYSALVFFALLATWLLLRGLAEWRPAWFVGYGVAAALGAYTHLTMIFVVVAQAAVCVWLGLRTRHGSGSWKVWRLTALAFGVAAVATIVLYAPMIPGIYGFLQRPHPTAQVMTPTGAAREVVRGLSAGMSMLGAAFGAALCLIGVGSYYRRQPVMLGLFLLPGLAIGLGALVLGLPPRPRFFFLLIGFGMLLMARGTLCVAQWMAARRSRGADASQTSAIALAVAIGMVALSVPSLLDNYRFPKQDFEGARRFIVGHRAADEPVVAASTAVYPFQRYYGERWDALSTHENLEVLQRRHRRVWVVYSLPEYLEPALRKDVEQGCLSIERFQGTLGGGDVVVCEAPGAASSNRASSGPVP